MAATMAAALGCDGRGSKPVDSAEATAPVLARRDQAGAAAIRCHPLPFAAKLDLPEASAATWFAAAGAILVLADSGHKGRYALVHPDTGAVVEKGSLPLGTGATDDLEGVAIAGDRIYGVTSGGWVRTWQRRGDGFALIDGPRPLAVGPDEEPAACPTDSTNCGNDFEALCLTETNGPDQCLGLVAAKTTGQLFCVVAHGDRLAIDGRRTIATRLPLLISGCELDGDAAWVTSNVLGLGKLFRIDDWRRFAPFQATPVQGVSGDFPEAIAVLPDGALVRFADDGGHPSRMWKYRCER